MFSRSTSNFDRSLEKATRPELLEPDWDGILQVCDYVRSGEVPPKYAACAIKKKLYASNPHVSLFALQVLESCVKNCGGQFHAEIANKNFMDDMRELVKLTGHEKVRDKICELIQTWAHAFRNDTVGRTVQDTLNAMRADGYKFPVLKESDAMFAADAAPQWSDADSCQRCASQFSLVQRKHHCRACGQIFCGKCSAKQCPIPKYGIEREVRVCDGCFDKLTKPGSTSVKLGITDSPAKSSTTASAPAGKSEQELQEEEELQLALAISQSEEEERKSRERRGNRTSSLPVSARSNTNANSSPATGRRSEPGSPKMPIDSELARYLDRDYWEQKPWVNDKRSISPAPSAPVVSHNNRNNDNQHDDTPHIPPPVMPVVDDDSNEIDIFLNNLRSGLEIFVNRMNSNKLRGRPIANDSSVQSLFMNITNMHSQLLKHMQDQDDQRLHHEGLQDKITQIRDARAALDSLREEHQDKLRLEAEEAERIRQQQMAQKLEIMRKKKQEYLQYQRQIALQRIQEQEAAMKTLQQTKYWPQGQGNPQMPYQAVQAMPTPVSYPPQGQPQPSHPQQQYQPPQGPVQGQYGQPPSYQPYNMQSMGHSLPPHQQQQTHPQSAGAPVHLSQPPVPGQHPAMPQHPPVGPPPQQQIHHAPQPPRQEYVAPPEPKPEVVEAPLISFD